MIAVPPSVGSLLLAGPRRRLTLVACCLAALLLTSASARQASASVEDRCDYWVAPSPAGDDANPGRRSAPWATLQHAAEEVPDASAVVCFEVGLYSGRNALKRRFTTPTTFRSVEPYRAVLESDRAVVDIDGGQNIILEGFEMRHAGPGSTGNIVNVDRRDRDGTWAQHITLRDNVIHDSHGDDLLKVHNGARFVTVEGNAFYNQADGEQHIDVNSVTDAVIQDNVLFNDFPASGRDAPAGGKHFIVIKDSNGEADGLTGSSRIRVRRNVLLNWEGVPDDGFLKVGNDGKPYHEAENVVVENNLFLGNSGTPMDAPFGVRGARDVRFVNNTVVGDLPSKSYAYRIHLKGENPLNEDITFSNNIWSDPTGSMGAESQGVSARLATNDPAEVVRLVHDHNLFWNGGHPIPAGNQTSPHVDDPFRVVADPELETDHTHVALPNWTGDRFRSGNATVREEFIRLANAYAVIPPGSPAVDSANPVLAPGDDILKRRRTNPDIGAYEADEVLRAEEAAEGTAGLDLGTLLAFPAVVMVLLPGLLAGRHRPRQDATIRVLRPKGGRFV